MTISSSDLTKVKHSIDNVTQKNFQLNVKCDSVLLWFCPLCHCSRTSQDSLKQSDSKLVATRLPAFSRTSGGFLDFTLSSHWPHGIFSFSLIGFVFGFTTLNRNTSRNSKKKRMGGRGGEENDNQEENYLVLTLLTFLNESKH